VKAEQLQAIKEREKLASCGPWDVYENRNGVGIGTRFEHPQLKGPVPIIGSAVKRVGHEAMHQVYIKKEDAEFIAHARQDVPTLIAEIERLQQALESVETACYSESNYIEIAKMARQALGGEQND